MVKRQLTKSWLIGLTLFCAVGARAGADEKGTVKTLTSVDRVRQGSTFQVAVVLDISPGWHAYEKETKVGIATDLKLTPPKGLSLKGNVLYPKGVKKNLAGAGGEVSVYEGKVIIGATLTAAKDAPLGKQTLKAALTYQVCTEKTCLLPVRGKPVDISVEVVKPTAPVKELNRDVFSKPPFTERRKAKDEGRKASGTAGRPSGTARRPSGGTAQRPFPTLCITPVPLLLSGGGIVQTIAHKVEQIGKSVNAQLSKGRLPPPLLFILWFGGLLSAFSPCVIPVIPLTIAFFGNQSRQAGGKAKMLLLALFYIAGIAALYSTIGVIGVIVFDRLNFILQGPALWLFIVIVFGGMGLSMFGLFEIPVPAFITSVAGARTGFIGAFMMGLVAAVLFLPCAGPVVGGLVGGLLVLKQSQASVLTLLKTGLVAFNVYSVGLGTPFLLLALVSGSAMKAPRSGDWTVSIKRIFGMVFVALAIFFMQYVPVLLLFAAFLLGCGIYLAFYEKRLGVRPTGKGVRLALALALLLISVRVAVPHLRSGLEKDKKAALVTVKLKDGQEMKGAIVALANAKFTVQTEAGDLKEVPADKVDRIFADEIPWKPYSDKLLAEAKTNGQPVVMDFTANW